MTLREIETRLAAIAQEVETDGADLDALEAEAKDLKEQRTALLAKAEQMCIRDSHRAVSPPMDGWQDGFPRLWGRKSLRSLSFWKHLFLKYKVPFLFFNFNVVKT